MSGSLNRSIVVRELVEKSGQKTLFISNLGFLSRELYSASDGPSNFYMLGSMGAASSLGLGLSLVTKKEVIVLDGDASILMNLGSLATIGNYA
ncbi:MAG: thiamine pyrophosphate-dependent enzyme, partial [Thaumarchaeota archaeon]|nr:thiamine pyrophosphate-dependent enzyme [Nitrososphaerota archaeon]